MKIRQRKINNKNRLDILSPIQEMKLLNAICALSDEEKRAYINKWKKLPLFIKIKYYIRSANFYLNNLFNKKECEYVLDADVTADGEELSVNELEEIKKFIDNFYKCKDSNTVLKKERKSN